MRSIKKPNLDVKIIVEECASSYKNLILKDKFNSNSMYISDKSKEYDNFAKIGKWTSIIRENIVNNSITNDEMKKLYNDKFVGDYKIREKYYDEILNSAPYGKCPICCIGHASTLDHYLPKSKYSTYTVTPINLIPVCKDCNFNKHDAEFTSDNDALPNPYYENIDDIIWLCAKVVKSQDSYIVEYFVNPNLEKALSNRLQKHLNAYNLSNNFSIQASSEIADNLDLWKKTFDELGSNDLEKYFKEVLESCEKNMKNTWKTALLRALIDNIDIFL